MSLYMANSDCTIEIQQPISGGSVTINSTPSNDVKANGKGVYVGILSVTVAGTTASEGALIQTDPVKITINPSNCTKVKSSGQGMIVNGDTGTGTGTYTNSSTDATSELPITVKVTDAGQTAVEVQ